MTHIRQELALGLARGPNVAHRGQQADLDIAMMFDLTL
jgi:hypothetical protein